MPHYKFVTFSKYQMDDLAIEGKLNELHEQGYYIVSRTEGQTHYSFLLEHEGEE